MKILRFTSLVIIAIAVLGCGSGDGDSTRTSATKTAQTVKVGMTSAEVEKAMGSKGAPDANDPNILHFPTADGDVRVTMATNGVVMAVDTQGDR